MSDNNTNFGVERTVQTRNIKKQRKIGLLTGIIFTVGTMLGSGIYIKNSSILNNTGGDIGLTFVA
jgi:hypothetical protein